MQGTKDHIFFPFYIGLILDQIADLMSQDEEDMGDEACDILIDNMEKQMGGGGNGG